MFPFLAKSFTIYFGNIVCIALKKKNGRGARESAHIVQCTALRARLGDFLNSKRDKDKVYYYYIYTYI